MNDAIQQRPNARWRWLRVLGTLIVCCAILGAAVAAVVVINKTEPTAQKENSSRKSTALVETVTVERGTYAPRLVVLGTVQAAQDIVLSPRVSGQVIDMSSKLVPGGMVRKGDLLLRIDPADFENAVSIRQSELAQKEASREIEQARQRLAEKELKMLEGSIDGANRSLVLREPQIASIEAEVSAAKAQVERATLDLDRTSVHAPFDAQVLSRSVNIGSQVGPNDELARLIGLDEYWIMAAVPVRSLRWVRFPKVTDQDSASSNSESYDGSGSTVILRNPDIWGPGVERKARVARMIGTLDSQTRLARVLIIVDDPLGLESDAPPLLLDTLIETEIEGQPIEDVVRLQRDYVRGNDTVWVKKDDKLEIRDTEIIFRDLQYAYVTSGLEAGEEVVTTTLATVAEGIGLRKVGEEAPEDTAETSSEEVSSDDASSDENVEPTDDAEEISSSDNEKPVSAETPSDENASDEASGQSESNSAGESSDTSKAEQAIDVTHTLSAVLARTVAACATSGLRSSSHSQERTPDCQAACFHGACWRTSQKDAVA